MAKIDLKTQYKIKLLLARRRNDSREVYRYVKKIKKLNYKNVYK